MNKHAGVLVILLVTALLAGCSSDKQTSLDYGKPSNQTCMVITDKGYKWDIDNSAPSFDETLKQVSFEVKQIRMPFPPSHTAASIIQAPFDMIQLTYANLEMGPRSSWSRATRRIRTSPRVKTDPS